MGNLLYSSLIFSVFAIGILVFRKSMDHRYSSRFFYLMWIILLVRLIEQNR